MAIGTLVGVAVERTRAIFARRPSAARTRKGATARLVADGWSTEVHLGTHTLIVDQPAALGGADAGPTPGDLIRAALAACLVQNYAMHARRFNVELKGIEVAVETDIDLRVAWGIETGLPPGFGAVRYTTTLTTDAPAEHVNALVEYAELHSPSLDDLRRALDVRGGLVVRSPVEQVEIDARPPR